MARPERQRAERLSSCALSVVGCSEYHCHGQWSIRSMSTHRHSILVIGLWAAMQKWPTQPKHPIHRAGESGAYFCPVFFFHPLMRPIHVICVCTLHSTFIHFEWHSAWMRFISIDFNWHISLNVALTLFAEPNAKLLNHIPAHWYGDGDRLLRFARSCSVRSNSNTAPTKTRLPIN